MKKSQKRYFWGAFTVFCLLFTFLLYIQGTLDNLSFTGTVLLTFVYLGVAALLHLYVKKFPHHFD